MVITLLLIQLGVSGALAKDPLKLELVRHPQFPAGRVAASEGFVGFDGWDFSVPDLKVSQPVILYVWQANRNRPLRLDIARFDISMSLRRCTTTPENPCVIKTRTDGDMLLRITSIDQHTSPYQLLVWVGDGVNSALPALFLKGQDAIRSATSISPSTGTTLAPNQNEAHAAAQQMTAKFFAYDAERHQLIVRDAVGATFEFLVRDDATIIAAGKPSQAGDYLRSHFNNLPYASDQPLIISWTPSADGKSRTALSVR